MLILIENLSNLLPFNIYFFRFSYVYLINILFFIIHFQLYPKFIVIMLAINKGVCKYL